MSRKRYIKDRNPDKVKRGKHLLKTKQIRYCLGSRHFVFAIEDELFARVEESICRDFVSRRFTESPTVVYRYSHNPMNYRDVTAPGLRTSNDELPTLPQFLDGSATEFDLEETIFNISESCYDSEQHAIEAQNRRLSIKRTKKARIGYVRSMGEYIVREVLRKGDIMATPVESDGHMNVLRRKGVEWKKCMDVSYGKDGYKKITYDTTI